MKYDASQSDADRARSLRRKAWGSAVAGTITALSAVGGQVGRWLDARRSGDVSQAEYLGRWLAIGFPSAGVLIALGTLWIYMAPAIGLLRARRLQRRFAGKTVLPLCRPLTLEKLIGSLLQTRKYRVTMSLTLVADETGIELWRGTLWYRVCGRADWASITAIDVEEHPPGGIDLYMISIASPDWPAPFEARLVSSPWLLSADGPFEPASEAVRRLTRFWHANDSPAAPRGTSWEVGDANGTD